MCESSLPELAGYSSSSSSSSSAAAAAAAAAAGILVATNQGKNLLDDPRIYQNPKFVK